MFDIGTINSMYCSPWMNLLDPEDKIKAKRNLEEFSAMVMSGIRYDGSMDF
jgi:hypothetical protein